jgi:dihydrofolate synthase/folylpolyglutamate synthase
LSALKDPQTRYPALHVAGTNGKGSTCAFAASCLAVQGYRVGLYTSPHLERVNERFRINGEEIADDALGEVILSLRAQLPAELELTSFEFGTLIALWHFAQEKVDVAVLETGLGGRLDATTAARPVVTAITPISFDHMDYLGHTLGAIATEKAGILKPGVPLVCAAQPPEALAAIEARAQAVGAPMRLLGRDFDLEPDADGTFTYRGMRTRFPGLAISLHGPHQRGNAAVAIACLELLEDSGLKVSRNSARAGLAITRWPGRLEEFKGPPTVVLDGAHNPAGVEALLAALDAVYPGREVHLVFGVLSDKDSRPMIRALFPRCASVTLTPVGGTPRSLDPQKYEAEARKLNANLFVERDAVSALAAARARCPEGGLVLGAGSLFLIGQLRAALR